MEPDSQGEKDGRGVSRRRFLQGTAAGLAATAIDVGAFPGVASAATNPITIENALPGTTDDWEISVFSENAIEGFATPYSINAGERVNFKIDTAASDFVVKIYRVGWYGGVGARKVIELAPSQPPQPQPAYYQDSATGLTDCSNWQVSAFWDVPANAVSGVYVANFELATGERNRAVFVVRNDGRGADIVVQTSDTTYQAYNDWGEGSLYAGYALSGRSTKVSYNRPYNPSEIENDFFYGEVPLVRWLERNGYDVSYLGNQDTATRPAELLDHKVFVSSGHDEYWSASMRTNIEAARDAGVNLVFMTGNEIFWRIRWEPSPVSSAGHETIVCYKETLQNAKVDPSPEWTGTWRDPRFTPPAIGGGNPENALTGTLFRAIYPINDVDPAIKVPAAYSQLRIWRNTSIANLTAGTSATLTDYSLGYEWNTDEDNGVRPNGLIRMSETTEVVPQVLQDNGSTYVEAPLTHYMTMYRAPSGALVWSTGTVQWSWGLDDEHFNNPSDYVPVDVRMQQATMNVLADMGVQPATRQAELVAATASTDTTPPTSTIQSPANGASGPVGSPVTISGAAVDSGGGVVAAVDVSTDGGTTWHSATGTTSWSYTFIPTTVGNLNVLSRATDDSCNIEVPGAGRTFVATPRDLPASIWPEGTLPAVASVSETAALELGVRFQATESGFVRAIRFYKGPGNTGTHVGRLWSNTGQQLGVVTFTGETATGWQTAYFAQGIGIDAGVTYVASYTAPNGGYAADSAGLDQAYELAPLKALASGEDGLNGIYGFAGGFPTSSYGSTNYWVDIIFDTDNEAPPAVAERDPAANVSSVDVASTVSVTFTEAVQAGTAQIDLVGPGGSVPGSMSLDSSGKIATFTPNADLNYEAGYTATVSGAIDTVGETMTPESWSFTTAGLEGELPTGLWTSASVPATAASTDATPVEVGLRFASSSDVIVRSIRFYQGPGNNGPHIGRLWDIDGNVLATATFTFEPGSGWREADLDTPVTIQQDVDYVVSYLASSGSYAFDPNYFSPGAITRGPLIGGTGVYRYGAGGGFPFQTYNGANYWVDVIVDPVPDLIDPYVVNTVPAPDIQAVATTEPIVVSFDDRIEASQRRLRPDPGRQSGRWHGQPPRSVDGRLHPERSTVTRPHLPGIDHGRRPVGQLDAGSVPVELHHGHDERVHAGHPVHDGRYPDVEASNDTAAIELGMKFSADVSGSITAIRFYKGPGNDGPHVGNLWDASGNLIGTTSFDNETPSVGSRPTSPARCPSSAA